MTWCVSAVHPSKKFLLQKFIWGLMGCSLFEALKDLIFVHEYREFLWFSHVNFCYKGQVASTYIYIQLNVTLCSFISFSTKFQLLSCKWIQPFKQALTSPLIPAVTSSYCEEVTLFFIWNSCVKGRFRRGYGL